MNPYIKDRVVKKLRYSGYRQASGTLVKKLPRRHYSYCALGVIGRACGMSPKELHNLPNYEILYERAGMTKKQGVKIYSLNDDAGYSFSKIADYVETHF